MAKYRVRFETKAWASVEVDVDDPELAVENAYAELPSDVCAQCSGWGRNWILTLGEEWSIEKDSKQEADGTWVTFDTEPELIED